VGDEIGQWEVQRLATLWGSFLEEAPGSSTTAAQQLAPKLARRGVVEPLLAALEHPSPALRRAVLEALVQAPRRNSLVPPILACLKDPFVEVRRAALEALAARLPELSRPASQDASLAPARTALATLAVDPVPEVRARAARLLGAEGRPTLEEMARDDSAPTALAALAVLEDDQADLLIARSADPAAEFRAAALERLADLSRPVPLDLDSLSRNLRHPDWRVRRGAVRCLGTFQSPQAQTLLASGLGDPAREVRLRAAAELEASGEEGVLAAEAYLQADAFSTVEAALAAMATGSSARARKVLQHQHQVPGTLALSQVGEACPCASCAPPWRTRPPAAVCWPSGSWPCWKTPRSSAASRRSCASSRPALEPTPWRSCPTWENAKAPGTWS